ncbi:MAG: TolC family protein [Bdellovibrionaceae bacterium]|nr:TolC family protein [Bdellovibrio sp.]
MNFLIMLSLLLPLYAKANPSFFDDLEKIQEKSTTLKSEEERLRATSDQLLAKKLFWTPTLSISAGRQQRHDNITNIAGSELTQTADYWKANAALNLFKGGGDWDEKNAAEAHYLAQKYKVLDESIKLDVKAAELIFQRLYLKDVLQTTKKLVKLRQDSHRIVNEKYKQGKSPLQEVRKSEIDQVQQLSRLRNLEIQVLENQALWKTLLIDDVATQNWPFQANLSIAFNSKSRTPELNSLENATAATESLYKAAKAYHWPSLDLTAEYKESPLNERTTQQWVAGVQLTIPIWSRYDTSAQSALAYAEFVTNKSRLDNLRRSELAQKEILNSRVELARQNLLDAKKSFEQSENLYQDMLKSFRFGRMSMNELLIEQNRLIESQMNLSQSQLDFHKMLIEGCAIAGLRPRNCLQ